MRAITRLRETSGPLRVMRYSLRRRSFASSARTGSVATVEPLTPRPIAGRPRRRSTTPPACSGRFELHPSGVMSLHDAADVDEREQWPEPSG